MSYYQLAKEAIKRKKLNDYKSNYQYLNDIMEKSLSQFEDQNFAVICTKHITPKKELVRLLRKEGFNIVVDDSIDEIKITPALFKRFTKVREMGKESGTDYRAVAIAIIMLLAFLAGYISLWIYCPPVAVILTILFFVAVVR